MTVALDIYEALKSVGVEDGKARSTAEKFDEALEGKLSRELKGLDTREDLAGLRGEIREEMAKIREEMANLEARLIKWNVGTIIAVVGLTIAIVKLVG